MKVQTILIDSLIVISATFLSGPWTEPFGQSDKKKAVVWITRRRKEFYLLLLKFTILHNAGN